MNDRATTGTGSRHARPGPDRPGPDQPAAGPTRSGRAGKDWAGRDWAGTDRTGKDRTGNGRPGNGRPGKDRAGKDRAGKDRAGKDRAGKDRAGKDRTGNGRAGARQVRPAWPDRVLRGLAGVLAGGLVVLALGMTAVWLFAGDWNVPGPGTGTVVGHLAGAVFAVAGQRVADRRPGRAGSAAAVLVILVTTLVLTFAWFL